MELELFKSPPFLINLVVLCHLPSPLYHYFVTVKSCFLLGTGEFTKMFPDSLLTKKLQTKQKIS